MKSEETLTALADAELRIASRIELEVLAPLRAGRDAALARAEVAEESQRRMRMTCRVNEEDNADQLDRRRAAESRLAAAEALLAAGRKRVTQLIQGIEENYRSDECECDDDNTVDGVIDADMILEDIRAIRDALSSAPAQAAEPEPAPVLASLATDTENDLLDALRECQAELEFVNAAYESARADLATALARISELEAYTAACEDLDPPDVLVHWKADRARITELERDRDAAKLAKDQARGSEAEALDEVRRLGTAIDAAVVELEPYAGFDFLESALSILRAAKTGGGS